MKCGGNSIVFSRGFKLVETIHRNGSTKLAQMTTSSTWVKSLRPSESSWPEEPAKALLRGAELTGGTAGVSGFWTWVVLMLFPLVVNPTLARPERQGGQHQHNQ